MEYLIAENRSSTIYLNPGDLVIMTRPRKIVWTVLGSCISVILYVPGVFSAVCHAQMPERSGSGDRCIDSCPHPCFNLQPESNDFIYVTCALEFMINELVKRGIGLSKVHVTLIGGSTASYITDPSTSVGTRNVAVARHILSRHGLRIDREDVGGRRGRTLRYFSGNNRLLVQVHGESGFVEL